VSVLSAALLFRPSAGSAQKVDPPTITTFAIGEDGKAESFTHEEMGTFLRVREKQ
jgi:hypothetical protein